MKLIACALLAAVLCSCSSMTSPIPRGAKPLDYGPIGAGEGPAWQQGEGPYSAYDRMHGFLYFTDGQHINRMEFGRRVTVFRDAAHAHSANGLMFDREGRLIACESGARRVTRTEKDGRITVLADRYRGKRFNNTNDLTMDSAGTIYFTDPRYGPRDGMEIRDKSGRAIEGVYRVTPPGGSLGQQLGSGPELLTTPGVERPNGILVSPDDRYLYICDNNNDTHGGSRKLVRFELGKDGPIAESRTVIFDWKNSRGPDGMKMDRAGRLYVAAGVNKPNEYETDEFKAGCYILSPAGKLLDFVPTAPDEATNCAFGGPDRKTLYITSGNHLWSIPVNTPGWSNTPALLP